VPLVKLSDTGCMSAKEKAALALLNLALDAEIRVSIASNGGIKPMVSLLESGTLIGQQYASIALTRLATENPDNQAQIAKRLVGLLDHEDASVVSRAAHDLQSLADEHPGAPVVIVNAGAISPLVTVLSNGKTDEGRKEAAKTLHTLANSGASNQLAIAIGLVALLGAGAHVTYPCYIHIPAQTPVIYPDTSTPPLPLFYTYTSIRSLPRHRPGSGVRHTAITLVVVWP
jgi:hypothetical protein